MTLKREISPYIDGNELVAPDPGRPSDKRWSDNGVLHTARYLILLHLNRETNDAACQQAIRSCIDRQGYLHRAPDDYDEDAPDDHYGAFSVFSVLGDKTYIALPWRCMHPMLLYMRALQMGGFLGLLGRIASPLMAMVIAFSDYSAPERPDLDTSNRLLTWNIVQGTKKSLLCRIGASYWYKRQDAILGPKSIEKVFQIYYRDHPMVKYFRR